MQNRNKNFKVKKLKKWEFVFPDETPLGICSEFAEVFINNTMERDPNFAGIIVLIILLTLKGLFHSSNEEENDLMEEKEDNQDENEIKPVQENNSRFPRFNLTQEKKTKKKKKHNDEDEDDDN